MENVDLIQKSTKVHALEQNLVNVSSYGNLFSFYVIKFWAMGKTKIKTSKLLPFLFNAKHERDTRVKITPQPREHLSTFKTEAYLETTLKN